MGRRRGTGPNLTLVVDDKLRLAQEMRIQGTSLQAIANELGYDNATQISLALKNAYNFESRLISSENRDGLLALEIERLDKLQEALWWDATHEGDTKAVDSIVRIIAQRSKLLGLDTIDARESGRTVLVISGDESDYVKTLKQIEGSNGNGQRNA